MLIFGGVSFKKHLDSWGSLGYPYSNCGNYFPSFHRMMDIPYGHRWIKTKHVVAWINQPNSGLVKGPKNSAKLGSEPNTKFASVLLGTASRETHLSPSKLSGAFEFEGFWGRALLFAPLQISECTLLFLEEKTSTSTAFAPHSTDLHGALPVDVSPALSALVRTGDFRWNHKKKHDSASALRKNCENL